METMITRKRPQLLTVICILSFVMCTLMIITNAFNIVYNTPTNQQKNIEQLRTINPEMADQLENNMIAMENNMYLKYTPHLTIVFNLLSLLGVLMMWNFNKVGFYLYSIAEILPYGSYLFVDASSLAIPGLPAGSAATYMMFFIIIMVLIDLAFVALYAKGLKEIEATPQL